MSKYDVIIIGGGIAGCSAGALLSKLGKKVLILEKDDCLGERVKWIPYEGYTLDLGAHLIEDPGSGLSKILEFLGKEPIIGTVSDAMPVFIEGKWRTITELYRKDKSQLKEIIQELVDIDYRELDLLDNIPLRNWLLKRTRSEGIILLFEFLASLEQLTEHWFDHSASENLFNRKLHYGERNMAGFSFWPRGGYQKSSRKIFFPNGISTSSGTSLKMRIRLGGWG